MKYIIGFIVGVALTIGGAAIYDNNMGTDKPLVNWSTVNDLQKNTLDGVKDQFGKLAKLIGVN